MSEPSAFRAEPILSFALDGSGPEQATVPTTVLGYEILRGRRRCPIWRPARNWRAWYLAMMTRQIPEMVRALPSGQRIFINLSSAQILDPTIQALVTACPYADRLVVEWIETPVHRRTLMAAARLFGHLREVGVQVAIDDVGTGHGQDGFGRLSLTGADYLKVDGRVLIRARRHKAARATLRALAAAAHDAPGTLLVVEWVETIEDWHLARDCGADAWQGFLSRDLGLNCSINGFTKGGTDEA